MLRRNWRRFIPIYAILPLVTTGLMNLFAYQLPKLIQLLLHSARSYDLTSALDVQFPFRPGWIWVYIATFLFWVYQYTTVARESPERACRLAAADFVAKARLLPLLSSSRRPSTSGRRSRPAARPAF